MGGVVTSTANSGERICKYLNISHDMFIKEADPLLAKLSDGTISTKEFWRTMSEKIGKNIDCDLWHCFFHPVLNTQTVDIIKTLRKNGERVVCGTNTIEGHYMNHVERGDYTFFDQTYASCFMGVSKPDTNFWKIILASEGVDPSETIFIDDKIANCTAASTLGIKAIQFESADKLRSVLGV